MRVAHRIVLVGIVIVILGLSGTTHRADAYPQFQFSTGAATCGTCHYNPAGGGLLNDYGRDEAGDTISGSGDGRFLHGAWTPPSWLQLGGDFRGALLAQQLDGQASKQNMLLVLPMQADLYARIAIGHFSICHTAYPRMPGIIDDFGIYQYTTDAPRPGAYDLRALSYQRAVVQENMPPRSQAILSGTTDALLTDAERTRLQAWLLAGSPQGTP